MSIDRHRWTAWSLLTLLAIALLVVASHAQGVEVGGQYTGQGQLSIVPAPATHSLTVTVSGTGTVTGNRRAVSGTDISCPPQCSGNYAVTASTITLTAVAGAGQTFSGWSGDCSGSSSTCSLTVSSNKAVTATFTGTGGGGGPTSYAARTDPCAFNLTYAASCSANAACSTTCNASQTAGESNALLTFTGGTRSAAITSLSAVTTTGTLVTTSSLRAAIGDTVTFLGATGSSASYWNGTTFTLLSANNPTNTYTFTVSGGPVANSTGTAMMSNDPLPFYPLNDVGGSGGASRGAQNNSFTDPDFGTYEVWVTDNVPAHMNGALATAVWNMGSAGQYDAFNQDSTLLTISNTGSVQSLFRLNPTVFHAHSCSPSTPCILISQLKSCTKPCSPDATHFDPDASAVFSRDLTDGMNTMLEIAPTKLSKLTINLQAGCTTEPCLDTITRTTIVDFTKDTPVACSVLPDGYNSTWNGVGNVSNPPTSFTITSGGGAPWPAIPGTAAGTVSQAVTTDIFSMPTHNLQGTTATIVSLSTSGGTGTLVTSTSLGAQAGEQLDFTGVTGTSASSWNNSLFNIKTANNTTFTYTFCNSSDNCNLAQAADSCTPSCGTAAWLVHVNTVFQVTTAGTTGATEPNWTLAPLAGNTLTDGSSIWTNVDIVGGQGPGFDVINYRAAQGCSYSNTRLGKIYRGHNETGAAISTLATSGGTSFTFTMGTPMVANVGQNVTYVAGSDATFNGTYVVATLGGTNPVTSFTATGTSHASATTTGGIVSEPWGKWKTDDAIACLLVGGSNCGTGGIVDLGDIFTLHGGSQALDSRFGELAPTGAGGVNNDWGPTSTLAAQGSGTCMGGSVSYTQLLGPWVTGTNYTVVGSNVTYNGIYYKLTHAISPSTAVPPSDAAHWAYNSGYCYLHFIDWQDAFVQPCVNLGPQFACDSHQVEGAQFIYKGGKYFNHTLRHPNCQTVGTCPLGAANSYIGGPNPGFNPGLGNLCSDVHPTYRNVGSVDLQPFFMPTWAVPRWPNYNGAVELGYPCGSYGIMVAYQNLSSVGSGNPIAYRFGDSYNSDSSFYFGTQQLVAVVSQLGDMVATSTDGMNSRGDALTVNSTCQHQLRGQYQPVAGSTTLTIGDTLMPIGSSNNAQAIFQVVACNGVTTPGTTCAYVNPAPNFNSFPLSSSGMFCDPSNLALPCLGGAELQPLGRNSCRGDVLLIDPLSSNVQP